MKKTVTLHTRITLPIPEEHQKFYGKEGVVLETILEIEQDDLLFYTTPESQHVITLTFEKPEFMVTDFTNILNIVVLFPRTTVVSNHTKERGLVAEQERSLNKNGTFRNFMKALYMCDNIRVVTDNVKNVDPAAVQYNEEKEKRFARKTSGE